MTQKSVSFGTKVSTYSCPPAQIEFMLHKCSKKFGECLILWVYIVVGCPPRIELLRVCVVVANIKCTILYNGLFSATRGF